MPTNPRKQRQAVETRLEAVVNVVGPDGRQVDAGTPIPPEWAATHPEFVAHLAASGGAVERS